MNTSFTILQGLCQHLQVYLSANFGRLRKKNTRFLLILQVLGNCFTSVSYKLEGVFCCSCSSLIYSITERTVLRNEKRDESAQPDTAHLSQNFLFLESFRLTSRYLELFYFSIEGGKADAKDFGGRLFILSARGECLLNKLTFKISDGIFQRSMS